MKPNNNSVYVHLGSICSLIVLLWPAYRIWKNAVAADFSPNAVLQIALIAFLLFVFLVAVVKTAIRAEEPK